MPKPKGSPKTGGRQKNTRNRLSPLAKSAVDDARQMMLDMGFDPVQAMIRLAKEAEAEGDKPLAMSGYREAAKYFAPQLKAVEVTGAGGGAVTIEVITGVPA